MTQPQGRGTFAARLQEAQQMPEPQLEQVPAVVEPQAIAPAPVAPVVASTGPVTQFPTAMPRSHRAGSYAARPRRRKWPLLSIGMGVMGVVMVVMFVVDYTSAVSQADRAAKRIAAEQDIARQLATLDLTQEIADIEESAALAHLRYQSECAMIMTYRDGDVEGYPSQIMALSTGMKVGDFNSPYPIADGQWLCDDKGMTFEVVGGVLAKPARATNGDIWNARVWDYQKGWNDKTRRSALHSQETGDFARNIADREEEGNLAPVFVPMPSQQ